MTDKSIEKPYDLIKHYMSTLNEHDRQVIKDLHAIKMRAYRKKSIQKVSVGRMKLDPEVKKENVRKTRAAYRARLREEKKANGTYRGRGRPKKIKEEVEEKTEDVQEKVEEKTD